MDGSAYEYVCVRARVCVCVRVCRSYVETSKLSEVFSNYKTLSCLMRHIVWQQVHILT